MDKKYMIAATIAIISMLAFGLVMAVSNSQAITTTAAQEKTSCGCSGSGTTCSGNSVNNPGGADCSCGCKTGNEASSCGCSGSASTCTKNG
jgi:hypothetical protein